MGTHEFAAPDWMDLIEVNGISPRLCIKRSALLDYTSLFFTLLFYAQHSKHGLRRRLPWADLSLT